jgi:preprotein translocase subunit SecE
MSTAIETNEPVAPAQRSLNPLEKLSQFFKDTRQEMHKVTTPSRAEVQATTIVVLVTVFVFAGYFFLVDFVLGKTLDKWLFHVTR